MGGLSLFQVGGLLFVTLSLVAGQLLFKQAALTVETNLGLYAFFRSLVGWQFILALSVYAVATLLWVVILTRVPLSRAYPFMALGFALVPLSASLIYRETLSLSYWAGLGFIFIGLYFVATGSITD